ncbi:MAG: hypothetical protein U5K54_14260 [Cytophagales bacterium]|nr:hypothetical protein [Cytophagales bacterium]
MKLSEDYTALILALLLVLIAGSGIIFWFPSLSWNHFSELKSLFNSSDWINLLLLFGFSFLLIWIAAHLKGQPIPFSGIIGYLVIFLITLAAHIITAFGPAKDLGLEIVIFSLLIGLFISNFSARTGKNKTTASNRTLH